LHNGRTVAEVLNDFKLELKEFIATRGQMLRAEMEEKMGAWKTGLPFMAIGALTLLVSFLVFTAGLVALTALAFIGQPWGLAVACFIVTAVYGLIGGFLLMYGWSTAKEPGLAPERTLKVLKEDQIWLQSEARSEL
jgi:hypothetical protein